MNCLRIGGEKLGFSKSKRIEFRTESFAISKIEKTALIRLFLCEPDKEVQRKSKKKKF